MRRGRQSTHATKRSKSPQVKTNRRKDDDTDDDESEESISYTHRSRELTNERMKIMDSLSTLEALLNERMQESSITLPTRSPYHGITGDIRGDNEEDQEDQEEEEQEEEEDDESGDESEDIASSSIHRNNINQNNAPAKKPITDTGSSKQEVKSLENGLLKLIDVLDAETMDGDNAMKNKSITHQQQQQPNGHQVSGINGMDMSITVSPLNTFTAPSSSQLVLDKLDLFFHFLLTFIQGVALFWFDESGAGPLSRFLRATDSTNLGGTMPTSRMIIFMVLGFVLSATALYLTEDEYIQGPKLFQNGVNQFDPTKYINGTDLPIHIVFQNLGCYIDGNPIIRNISGDIRPGRLTGILGQSGSGKTTFSMSLMGRARRNCKPSTGQVFLNGQERSLESFIDRVGFVPQDDVLYPELTVEETLRFSGNWRLPRYFSERDKDILLEDTLAVLGLERVRHSRVGNVLNPSLSGGERKRVSIGIELMALPSVLILDEPTSGLDASAAFRLVKMLESIAKRNVSVVAVLHQPSSRVFSLLDDVILVQKGRAAYVGPREKAGAYFTSAGFENTFVDPHITDNGKEVFEPLPEAEFLLDVLAELVKPKCENQSQCPDVSLGDLWEKSSLRANESIRIQNDMQKYKKKSLSNTGVEDKADDNPQTDQISSFAECDGHTNHFVRNICLVFYGARNAHKQSFRPKPGVLRQSILWLDLLVTLSFRRGLLIELAIISILAWCVAFTSSYNSTWNRKPFGVFFISLAIALPGLTGAVLEDDILPVRRAINSGMLIGAYEFAIIVFSFVKGWAFSQVFALNYHGYLYQEGNKEEEEKERKFCSSPFSFFTYYEFTHLLHMNYLAARGIGNFVCVLADHRPVLAFVIATTILVCSHVNCYFSPNRTQLDRAGAYLFFGKFNFAPMVHVMCSFSYVRYFLEAMLLWDPDREDKVARSFALRYFGYKESNKPLCVAAMVALWIGGQAIRFLVFALRNSSDFNNLYDSPLFVFFFIKVITGYLIVLLVMTIAHELPLFKSAWIRAVDEAFKRREEQIKKSQIN